MRKLFLVLVVAMLSVGTALGGEITITVLPALAPNAYGSPSFAGWQNNTMYALEHGLSTYGAAGPTQYNGASSTLPISNITVTGFPSWMGNVDPGNTVGPAYASELGNRLHFGLVINGNGNQFSISQLSFNATSSDPWDYLGFGYGAGGYDYSAAYMGIIYGPGGPTYITSGPNTQLVDALIGRGSGNAGPVYCSPCTLDQERSALWNDLWYYAEPDPTGVGPFTFTGTYALEGTRAVGSATVLITGVPEPATVLLLAVGGLGMFLRRRRA